MKNKIAVVTLISGLLFACSAFGQAASVSNPRDAANKIGKQLVGVWRLIRYVDMPEGAQPIYAFGERPVGQFVFTADGNVSINIMRNPPAPTKESIDIDPDACIPAWYCSYFGTYRLEDGGRKWTTHVQGGNIPTYVGTNQTRSFELSGNRLVISESYEEGGRTVRAERVLERAR